MKKGRRPKIFRNKRIDFSDNLFFEYDYERGHVMDLIFNRRAILANQEFWQIIHEGLFSILKSNAPVILYQVGLEYGLAVGTKAKERNLGIQKAIIFLESYGY